MQHLRHARRRPQRAVLADKWSAADDARLLAIFRQARLQARRRGLVGSMRVEESSPLERDEPDRRVVLDRKRPLQDARDVGHTRWHPDIPPIARIAPGEVIEIDVRDGGDVQIDWTT